MNPAPETLAVFGVILVRIFPHLDGIQKNTDQNNSEYELY